MVCLFEFCDYFENLLYLKISSACRVRALAAAWSRHDNPLADGLLADSDKFGVVEVLKAVQLLGK